MTATDKITIVGGGLAGLTAAITCAEQGARVTLLEAHDELGGRARTTAGPYRANLGPHAILSSSPLWKWLGERGLLPPYARPRLSGVRFRWQDDIRRVPAVGATVAALRLRNRPAPVDVDFRTWVTEQVGEEAAEILARSMGILTYYHDPGELSAAFVWEPLVRGLLSAPPSARYPIGGWSAIVEAMRRRAQELEVEVRTGSRVEQLPDPPVIVATELADGRALLGDDSLHWTSGHAVCLDLALTHRRGDPFVVVDLQESGWVERYSAADSTLAPDGEELIQAQMPIRPGEAPDKASQRLERLLDASFPGWRERERWRRRQVMDGRTAALDFPGQTWRDRPAVDRGGGVFLAGDMVAAPAACPRLPGPARPRPAGWPWLPPAREPPAWPPFEPDQKETHMRLTAAQPHGLDLIRRLSLRTARRMYGRETEPLQVMAHHRPVMLGVAAISLADERFSHAVEEDLKHLARLRAAQLVGCEWCLDFGSYLAQKAGADPEKLRALATWRDSTLFDARERLVLEYAEAMTRTPVELSDELFAQLQDHFDERQLVELTMSVALENLYTRFNWAMGIEGEGFTEGMYCVRPQTEQVAPAADERVPANAA